MKVRPILFNGESVRGILAGRKSQTRRVIKPQPRQVNDDFDGTWEWKEPGHYYDDLTLVGEALIPSCPYGVIGDRLWLRETFCGHWTIYSDSPGSYSKPEVILTSDESIPQKYGTPACTSPKNPLGLWYKATSEKPHTHSRWCPSIHMPRWASRITLEVVSVRVERVQDITYRDALAEGIQSAPGGIGGQTMDACGTRRDVATIKKFSRLWNSINEKRGFGWDTNCWVWCVEFKVVSSGT